MEMSHLPANSTDTSTQRGEQPLATKQKRRKKKPAKIAKTLYKQHITTDANATGLGEQAARLPGRMATEQLWAFQPKSPKWLPPVPRTKMPPGGLSSAAAVELELERAHALTRLRRKFQDLCKEAGIEVPPKLAFEKWRFAMKWREDMRSTDTAGRDKQSSGNKRKKKKGAAQQQPSDPLIPCLGKDWSCTAVEPGLTADLERAGISEDSAKGVAQSLANESHKAALEVAALKHKLASGRPPMPKSELPILTVHKHSMDLHCRGQFVKLTGSALTKLQLLYQQNLPLADGQHALLEAGQESPQCAFTDRLFALLLRYKTIQGHGFQAAAGPQVFRLLTEQLGVALECFASPLNTFLGRFCSAFPDVDCPFGSQGSFWGFAPSTGSYQVNPPFVPCIMDAMADRLVSLLTAAEGASAALSFVVFVPGWEECKCWSVLKTSPFLRGELLIAAKDHGYCDGASHQRRDSFRVSCYDTGAFILQTAAASRKWVVSTALLDELRQAMAMSVPIEGSAKRQKRSR